MIAKAGEKYIVSLPGFPYSSFVTFLLYVVPIADALENKKSLQTIEAKLRDDFVKKFKKTQFVAVNLSFENGEYVVDIRGKKQGSSGILTNLINNNALMMLDEGLYSLSAGEKVKVIIY
jgi:molybdopterin molybdotransferase